VDVRHLWAGSIQAETECDSYPGIALGSKHARSCGGRAWSSLHPRAAEHAVPNAPLGLCFPAMRASATRFTIQASLTSSQESASLGRRIPPQHSGPHSRFHHPDGRRVLPESLGCCAVRSAVQPSSSSNQFVPFDNPWTNFKGGPGSRPAQARFLPSLVRSKIAVEFNVRGGVGVRQPSFPT